MSTEALNAKGARLRGLRIHRRTDLTLDDLAAWLNPIVAGWMNYYGRYYRAVMDPLLRRVNIYMRRWAGKKYRAAADLQAVHSGGGPDCSQREPGLFAQWRVGPLATERPVRRAR